MNCVRLENLLKIISVLALAIALQACSTVKLVYNQSPEVAWWYMTDYLDFTDPQRPPVRAALTELHRWHRRQQLPAYAGLLQRWQGTMAQDVTAAQTCDLYTEVMTQLVGMSELAEQMPADALTVVTRLSPAQLGGLSRNLTKSNQRYREEYLQGSATELRDKRFKQALSRAEGLYGRFDERQKSVLQAGLDRTPFDGEAAYARRLQRQQELLQTLRTLSASAAPLDQARAMLRGLFARSLRSYDPANRQDLVGRQQGCQLLADVHNSTGAGQRQKAADTLGRYAADMRSLASEP